MSPTLRDLVSSARASLAAAGIAPDEAARDAALLARDVLGWDLARFVAHDTDCAPGDFAARYGAVVARRAAREPMSSLTGRREFWGLAFEVTPAVLAPRPETETIIEAALERCDAARAGGTIVDVGTGSGCLAICLARELPGTRLVATDISPEALAVAARNASRHGVSDRLTFVRTSLLDDVSGPVSLVVSNPPYIPTSDIAGLPPEVRNWEPRAALDGGADGLDLVRRLLADAPRVLVPGGWLIMEFGFGQEPGIREAVAASGLALVEIRNDLQGIPRTLVARRRNGLGATPKWSRSYFCGEPEEQCRISPARMAIPANQSGRPEKQLRRDSSPKRSWHGGSAEMVSVRFS
jgi:release factor glutamine methyltransferase